MRIALVCPYSWTAPGGVQSHVRGLARELRRREHSVEILAPADAAVEEGVTAVGRSIPIPDNGTLVRVALSPAAAARTARLVRSRRHDVVHLHEPMIPAVCLTALLTSDAPLVGTFHMYASSRRWYRPFAPLARRAIPRLAARVAVSQAALRHVARICPGEYHVIPNGIDLAAFGPPGARTGTRVVFVGRPDARKGLSVLLEAFKRLPHEVELDLVGVAPADLARAGVPLPAEVARRVRAHGRVPDAERSRLLADADILCAPSLEGESFGIVLVEGMAAGLPVVASAIPGYVDVLAPACGVLVPPGDVPALAEALRRLLAEPATREELGRAGREHAERFGWERVADRIVEVYEGILG